jgi:hypothetical protein
MSSEDKQRQQNGHEGKTDAELLDYGRHVSRMMKANGYHGIVWDEVLDRFERLTRSSCAATVPEADLFVGFNKRMEERQFHSRDVAVALGYDFKIVEYVRRDKLSAVPESGRMEFSKVSDSTNWNPDADSGSEAINAAGQEVETGGVSSHGPGPQAVTDEESTVPAPAAPTPRTDAMLEKPTFEAYGRMADFARQLERELAEKDARLGGILLSGVLDGVKCGDLQRWRDEFKAKLSASSAIPPSVDPVIAGIVAWANGEQPTPRDENQIREARALIDESYDFMMKELDAGRGKGKMFDMAHRLRHSLRDLYRIITEASALSSTTAPVCQYAADVGMPEYRCAKECQYAPRSATAPRQEG